MVREAGQQEFEAACSQVNRSGNRELTSGAQCTFLFSSGLSHTSHCSDMARVVSSRDSNLLNSR